MGNIENVQLLFIIFKFVFLGVTNFEFKILSEIYNYNRSRIESGKQKQTNPKLYPTRCGADENSHEFHLLVRYNEILDLRLALLDTEITSLRIVNKMVNEQGKMLQERAKMIEELTKMLKQTEILRSNTLTPRNEQLSDLFSQIKSTWIALTEAKNNGLTGEANRLWLELTELAKQYKYFCPPKPS